MLAAGIDSNARGLPGGGILVAGIGSHIIDAPPEKWWKGGGGGVGHFALARYIFRTIWCEFFFALHEYFFNIFLMQEFIFPNPFALFEFLLFFPSPPPALF